MTVTSAGMVQMTIDYRMAQLDLLSFGFLAFLDRIFWGWDIQKGFFTLMFGTWAQMTGTLEGGLSSLQVASLNSYGVASFPQS